MNLSENVNKAIQKRNKFRSIPFWSWNDNLDIDELTRQIDLMEAAGIGGFVMHARSGLRTEYLGFEWMNDIKACAGYASQKGMVPLCYDENGWPSGSCSGFVTAENPEFCLKWIEWSDQIPSAGEFYSFYMLGDTVYRALSEASTPPHAKIIGYASIVSSPDYIDVLDPSAVKSFIAKTHEKYRSDLPSNSFDQLAGFFTDEPQYAKGKIPWSFFLESKYNELYARNLADEIPFLFIRLPGYQTIRFRFWKLVSELFNSSYMKQMHDWCIKNNKILTGHLLREETIYSQMQSSAGVMASYEYFDIPGMDWLGRWIGNSITPMQLGSVACQLGKKKIISECYAMTGWDVSFQDLYWIAGWMNWYGVNLLCPHLQGYSLRGNRKRDYPPSLFFQQSWFQMYKSFNDRISALFALQDEIKYEIGTLVLHPMQSAWLYYDGERSEEISNIDSSLEELSKILEANGVSYHYGDEQIIQKYGYIDDAAFCIGQCRYKEILIPDIYGLSSFTYDLLVSFSQTGGRIYGNLFHLQFIDGTEIPEKCDYLRSLVEPIPDFSKRNRKFRHTSENLMIKEGDFHGSKAYYLFNRGEEGIKISIDPGLPSLVKLDFETLKLEKIKCNPMENAIEIPPKSFGLYFESSEAFSDNSGFPVQVFRIPELSKCDFKAGDNLLVLDYCYWRQDNKEWHGLWPVIKVQQDFLKRNISAAKLDLLFRFYASRNISTPLYVIAELRKGMKLEFDGREINEENFVGVYKDKCLRKYILCSEISAGEHQIMISMDYMQSPEICRILSDSSVLEGVIHKLTYDTELENIYIAGNFAVFNSDGVKEGPGRTHECSGQFYVDSIPERLHGESIVENGFPFYADKFELTWDEYIPSVDKKFIFDSEGIMAPAHELIVNGRIVSHGLNRLNDITDVVKQGRNEFCLRLYASNRNMFGPLHNKGGEPLSVGPSSFGNNAAWADRRIGLESPLWKDEYFFVKTGVKR